MTIFTTELRVGTAVRFTSRGGRVVEAIRSAPENRARITFTDGHEVVADWDETWDAVGPERCFSCGAPFDSLGSCLGSCDPNEERE